MLFLNDKTVPLSTDCSIDIEASYTESATKDNGIYSEQDLEKISYTISNTALMCETPAATDLAYKSLLQKMVAETPVEFAVCVPSNWDKNGIPAAGWQKADSGVIVAGSAKINKLSLSGGMSGDAQIQCSLVGDGALSFEAA